MINKNKFILYSKITTKSLNEIKDNKDSERLTLEGVASTKNRDLQDEIIDSACLKSMQQQAPGLTIMGDHTYGLFDGVIGAVKEVLPTDDDSLKIKFQIRNKFSEEVKDILSTGINQGLSIDGQVTDYIESSKTIKGINLREISLTAMPANWDTYGTVTTTKD